MVEKNILNLNIPQRKSGTKDMLLNPDKPNYDFMEVKSELSTRYIFIFKVIKWGHNGKHAKASLQYYAAFIDTGTGKTLWEQKNTVNESPETFGTNLNYSKDKALKYIKSAVKKAVDNCLSSLR